ncbi:hypothetical protein [Enterovibrio norvegicus]|uniref:hypothetical protein n=1 Tax=Enterovibrio norvegicus TaxID=188144 RepID=UPI00352F7097
MNPTSKAKLLANSISKRMYWEQQLKPLLKENQFPVGVGVKNTLNKLYDAFEQSEVFAQKFISIFSPYHEQALLAGDRTIKLYKLSESEFLSLQFSLLGCEESKGVDREYFPFSVPDNELGELGFQSALTKLCTYGEKTYLFISTCRRLVEKIEIDPKRHDGSKEVVDFLKQYKCLTAFTDKPRQYIDIVVLNPKDFTIELRLDTSSAIAKKDIDGLFRDLQEAFLQYLSPRLDFCIFGSTINFFPFIKDMYLDKNDLGRVVELSFATDGGYVHNDQKRTKGGDVRDGQFHQGGREKCDVYPYRISKRWVDSLSDELKSEYELSLNSNVKELSKPIGEGHLDHAVIAMCPTMDKFDEILERLKSKDELSKAV